MLFTPTRLGAVALTDSVRGCVVTSCVFNPIDRAFFLSFNYFFQNLVTRVQDESTERWSPASIPSSQVRRPTCPLYPGYKSSLSISLHVNVSPWWLVESRCIESQHPPSSSMETRYAVINRQHGINERKRIRYRWDRRATKQRWFRIVSDSELSTKEISTIAWCLKYLQFRWVVSSRRV